MGVRSGVLVAVALAATTPATATTLRADVASVTLSGSGASIGTVTISDSAKGAVIKVKLHGLTPGPHAFHIHQNPSCAPGLVNGVMAPAGAAGGHYGMTNAPMAAGAMPMGAGAMPPMGDLPTLTVKADGTDSETLIAARLTQVAPLRNHPVMIHAGDETTPRIACGLLK